MSILSERETVREIALNQPSSIRVFEQFGIDYCCGGRKPLAAACTDQNIEIEAVLAALESASTASGPASKDWTTATLASLIQHITSTHHAYVVRELPRLTDFAQKVVARHGATRSELPAIQVAVAKLDEELTQHLAKEERILFPYIVELERALADGSEKPHSCLRDRRKPRCNDDSGTRGGGNLLAEIRRLSSNFTTPDDACPTYRGFYDSLREFEQDLHQHIHLENNILFPRAIAMEANARQ